MSQNKSYELHNFADASTSGYGQCSYLRVKDEDGNVNVSLVMGKSRVALLKITTIPRLELARCSSFRESWRDASRRFKLRQS